MNLDIARFKDRLEKERQKLEEELGSVGRRTPENKDDWEGTPPQTDGAEADRNEAADRIEDLEENIATERELEARLEEVKRALDKIKNGTYGICETGNHPIEELRLEANPAARTCLTHLG